MFYFRQSAMEPSPFSRSHQCSDASTDALNPTAQGIRYSVERSRSTSSVDYSADGLPPPQCSSQREDSDSLACPIERRGQTTKAPNVFDAVINDAVQKLKPNSGVSINPYEAGFKVVVEQLHILMEKGRVVKNMNTPAQSFPA